MTSSEGKWAVGSLLINLYFYSLLSFLPITVILEAITKKLLI